MNYKALLAVTAICGASVTVCAQSGARPDIRPGDQSIVIVATPMTFVHWSKTVTKGIEDHLFYPHFADSAVESGVVAVRFMCSEGGTPTAVTLYRKSGNRLLDMAAMRAVSRVTTLHPMPAYFRPNQTFLANILFATSKEQHDQQIKDLQVAASHRVAGPLREGEPIALIIGSHADAGS